MTTRSELFHKETPNQTYWTCFKEHNVFCPLRWKIYFILVNICLWGP